jgi:hypothetical protein
VEDLDHLPSTPDTRHSFPHDTCFTGGIFQLPSMTEGVFSFGQYMRSIKIKLSIRAGSQSA